MSNWQELKECPVFSHLQRDSLEQIIELASEKEFEAGTTVFKEGDKADELLVLLSGRIAIQMAVPSTQEKTNRRITIDMVTLSEIVGWSAIVEPYIYTLTAVCVQNTKVLSISGSKFRGLLDDNPKMGYQVLKEFIKVVALRLDDTRQVLLSERMANVV